ncbi:hypothetical protein BKA70DRAFT_885872 [Coprinopsis sp. MPI-PUGE-AT-0042]|nr:hypothetical protein BKA70DRAFT_885872 [Coprinopsis sp. MPI-PUGE-AT-0042]
MQVQLDGSGSIGHRLKAVGKLLQVERGLYSSSNQLETAPLLYHDPTPHLTRVANHPLRTSTSTAPVSLKRKVSAHGPEEGETEMTSWTKVMTSRATRNTRQHERNHPFYETFVRHKREKSAQAHETAEDPPPAPNHRYLNSPPIRPPPKIPTCAPTQVHAMARTLDNQGQIIYNATPYNSQPTYPTSTYSTMPLSGPATHQFVSRGPPAPPAAPSMAPQVSKKPRRLTLASGRMQQLRNANKQRYFRTRRCNGRRSARRAKGSLQV